MCLCKMQEDEVQTLKILPSYDKEVVREPKSESCLDLIFASPPCEKVIIVPDTNYMTSAIRKFMLDLPSPGSFENIGLSI